MPIAAELRQFYSKRSGWPQTRARILDRAQYCCERCGAPGKLQVLRAKGAWFDVVRRQMIAPGELLVDPRPPIERGIVIPWDDGGDELLTAAHLVYVQLGVAHINHRSGDDRDENLAAWCRECHLAFDAPKHRDTRAMHKDQRRPLLADAL